MAKPTSIKKPPIIRPHPPERSVACGPRIDPAVQDGAQSNPVSRSQVSDAVTTGSRSITAHVQPSVSFQHRVTNPALVTAGSGPCNGGLLAATSQELQSLGHQGSFLLAAPYHHWQLGYATHLQTSSNRRPCCLETSGSRHYPIICSSHRRV